MARFVIVETAPIYSSINDGLIGSTTRVRWDLGTFETETFAHKRCGLVYARHYEGCGDSSFHVANTADPFRPVWTKSLADAADMPF
jgi:hypothetical protein